jgi:hypothetical protein
LADPPEDWEQPTPLDDEKRETYKSFRKAMAAAKAKANRADLSVRKAVLDRQTDEAFRIVGKQRNLMLGEVEDVVRLGEVDDGRAARRADAVVKANLRARNEMMLNALGVQLNAQLASVLQRAQAQASTRSHFPPYSGYLGPGVIINGPLGHPLDKMSFIDGGASVRPLGR